ncbi:helix-turn-helix transcriptional regulator [Bradyrhizobium sp. AZCC 1693]|uniref:helix-turn-helix transcriptional regulator n=1 Tax=Bradyrhizobium sp. AZCC 1693 TaxID=3117029 RepID=UPI002FF3BA83
MFDVRKLEDVGKRLGDAVLDPLVWTELMEDICQAADAKGAAMLQSDVRTEDIPRTEAVSEFFDNYFRHKFHVADVRAARGVPLLQAGADVVRDADLFRSEAEMLRDPLYANLAGYGLKWFAAIGFRAGPALWGLTIQRTPKQGMFESDEVKALSRLSHRLTEAATLSTAVGRAAILSVTNALDLMQRPALAIDRHGGLLGLNRRMEAYIGGEILVRNNRLVLRDSRANSELSEVIDRLKETSDQQACRVDPIIVRRESKRPLVLKTLPVPPAARSPFLGARAVLALSDLEGTATVNPDILGKVFELTPAQAMLAGKLATGSSMETAAAELGVTVETARTHLKAIFNRTGTHRQGELVALLNRLSR